MTDRLHYPDALMVDILRRAKTIAMVGASPDPTRPSAHVMEYLQDEGYRVVPVNPYAAGRQIHGETCFASLREIPRESVGRIDMVDIFRRSDKVEPIVEEAIEIGADIVWMQLGVRNETAAARAEAAGLTVIMDRCPRIEIDRLRHALKR